MAHQIESMFFQGETPWHGLGNRVTEARHYIKIGDTSVRARVWIQWTYDDQPIDVDFGEEENALYEERFRSGELINAIIQVNASWQDAEACDILGACHLVGKDLEDEIKRTVDSHGMVVEALKQLQTQITNRAKLYKFKGI